ncbi:MAG: ribonuclease III domain-containing protein [Eubacteriales bacterium]|nr:ribonuclease III domain-containing protein [Eubacteriales bacterium]
MEKSINNNSISILKYAYIGDAFFELYVRNYLISNYNIKIDEIHKLCTKIVCANSQSFIIKNLEEKNELFDEEINIYKKGRNTKTHSKSKNSDIIEYKHATGFEALIGFLYLSNNFSRLKELLKISMDIIIDKVK